MANTTKLALLLALTALSVTVVYFYDFDISTDQSLVKELGDNLECGFTPDFQSFLDNSGYKEYQFNRPDLKCAAFGGRSSATQKIKKAPIIFIHGNSDVAFGRGTADGYVSWQTGFRSLATYLISQGYDKSELYTTTWGPADPNQASNNYHSKKIVLSTRAFVQAVLAYTKAKQIVVISHSMGVSIGRRVIKGGQAIDHVQGNYNVGQSLASKVKVFVGLAGANYGLTACYSATTFPTCGTKDGFYPGLLPNSGPSKYLNDINMDTGLQGQKTYTIWSKYDDLIGLECLVWGKSTCRIPSQTAQVVKTTADWTHFKVRDASGPDIINWL